MMATIATPDIVLVGSDDFRVFPSAMFDVVVPLCFLGVRHSLIGHISQCHACARPQDEGKGHYLAVGIGDFGHRGGDYGDERFFLLEFGNSADCI